MVQADGEVVGDVGVPGCQAVGLEVGLLRFGPALLGGQGVTEGEVRADCVGLVMNSKLKIDYLTQVLPGDWLIGGKTHC